VVNWLIAFEETMIFQWHTDLDILKFWQNRKHQRAELIEVELTTGSKLSFKDFVIGDATEKGS
jgi:hypothetical protein